MITNYEIQRRICNRFEFDITDDTTEFAEILKLIKFYINECQEIVYQHKMPWMKQEGRIALQASYSDETITTAEGSAGVTGDSTVFTRDMVGQKIVITDATDGDVIYRIKSYSSATSITLDTKYIHTGGAGQSYVIYYDVYTLPPDFKTIEVMKDVDPMWTYYNDEDYLLASGTTSDVPREMKYMGARTSSYYSTGTISITTATSAVTGVGTVFDDFMIGRYMQLGNYGKLYEITAVASALALTIGDSFGGATISGGNFHIDPPGLQQVRFHSTPSAAKIIPYTYWPKATRLVDNNDISPIPNDSILVEGGMWKWLDNEDNPRADKAEQNFNRLLALISTQEIDVRQQSMSPVYEHEI